MQISDIVGMLVWALFMGGFAFVILAQSLRPVRIAIITRWCLSAGVAGIGLFILLVILNFRPSAKALILLFITLPIFVCGLLLSIQNLVSKHKK